MLKKILRNLRSGLWLYVLTLCNIVYAIDEQQTSWLLLVAIGLSVLSLIIGVVSAVKEGSR